MNTPRQETGAARIGGTIYVVGGLLAGFTATATVEAYDIADEEWSFAPSLPEPRDHMGVAAFGRRIVVAGSEVPQLQSVTEFTTR